MYEEYFGLERPPFKITPDTSLFYEGGKRGDILAALVYAIHRGEGIIKVVGEVGSGKTMLCRMLQLELPATVEIVYIANPSVSAEDILFVIAHELSLPVAKDASKHEVMHLLQDYLLQRHMENKQVVLFVEEAQGMPLDTLEEIRLLSNLETDENKLLQIILFGQPELDENLAQQSIRQLRERITHNFDLEPLTQDEIHSYLNFRMREVGYTGPELINSAVARKVEVHSEGLLRRINIIADKILLSAFAEGTHNLSAKHVTAAVEDSAFSQSAPSKSRAYWWLMVLAAAALMFALYQTRPQMFAMQAAEMAPKQEIAAINDKPITDIATQTSETEPIQAITFQAGKTLEADSNQFPDKPIVVTVAKQDIKPPETPEQGQLPGKDEEPGTPEQLSEVNADKESRKQRQQFGLDVQQETLAISKQVDDVVQQVEAAVQQAKQQARKEKNRDLQTAPEKVASSDIAVTEISTDLSLTTDHNKWLNMKLQKSRDWLRQADRGSISIQVLMRRKSAARELVDYLRNEWPLDLSETYLYEVNTDNKSIYRVFYSEFNSLAHGRNQLELLPESVKINSPYLHSVYRMQKALL